MVPVTESELLQLKLTGLAPDRVEPLPVPMVVQPAASATSSGNASLAVEIVMSFLLRASGIAAVVRRNHVR
jgi:hypothetical protein